MRRLRRVVATVTTVAVLGLSAACGGDNPTPSTAPSNTPSRDTPDAADSPPTPASEIQKKSKAGAVAATRLFLESLNYSGRTGDTEALRKSYTKFCTRCEAIADGIDEVYEQGGEIRGGEWLPQRFKFYSIQSNVAYVDAVVDYSPQTWKRSSSATAETVAARSGVLKAFNLRWRPESGWSVSALDPQA